MRLFDLSLRHKLPLWGGILIVITALTVAGSNILLTRENLKRNMLTRSEILGHTLTQTLYTAITQDDVWRAYETLDALKRSELRHPGFQIEDFILLDHDNQVFTSTLPEHYPLQIELDAIDPGFLGLRERLAAAGKNVLVHEIGDKLLLAVPVIADNVKLGTLILVHPTDYYLASFTRILKRTIWTTLVVMLILLPINWYWGRRMTAPLSLLADRMGDLGKRPPEPIPRHMHANRDELGRLFAAFDRMSVELEEKERMKREIVKSDRLAALGRLSAGIAHEINNPLGGLLTALDTLKRHASPDPVLTRVLPLLERGLTQIRDVVAALLVEARARSRPLTGQDIDDVHTLLGQEAHKRGVETRWENSVAGEIGLPASLVRQILINLALNAIQAAGEHGRVTIRTHLVEEHLVLDIHNDGQHIPPELMERLFEPFTGQREDGMGLGLWITHQITRQLKGNIVVHSQPGDTRFCITLPLGDENWLADASA
jgi:signal transduction histidine kinase